jgi:predicted PurR-regulated permease PerM
VSRLTGTSGTSRSENDRTGAGSTAAAGPPGSDDSVLDQVAPDPVDHPEGGRTGLTGAPDPEADDEAAAAARDGAAHRWLVAGRRKDPMGDTAVPRGLQIAASWAWRLVALAAAAWVVLQMIARTQLVIVPVVVALLLSALLQPLAAALAKRGMPPTLASALVLLGGLVGIGLLVWLVVNQFRTGLGDLTSQVEGGIDEIRDWLVNGPLGLSQTQLDNAIASAEKSLSENRSTLTSGAVGAATTAGHVLTGLLLALFATFFFLKDGPRIWSWVVRLFPADGRNRADGAGRRAWHTLISYVRATLAVAFVDAVGIGVGAALLGVPLALPLAVIVFLGSFVPIIGATLSGLVAVLVALVAKGPVTALILLGVVLLVQQLEGHVLQPLLLGRAIKVHPLAVVFGIATGVLLAGIVGALIAVPIVAVVNTVATYLSREDRSLVPTDTGGGGAAAPAGG